MHAAQLGDSARGLLSSVLALGQQPIRPDAQHQCSVDPAAWQPSRRLTSAPAWAGHGQISGGAALAVGSNPTVARPFRPNKNGLVALPLETLDHSFFSFFSALPVRVRWRRRRRWPLATVPLDPAAEPPWPAIPSSTLSSLPSPLSVRSAHRDEHGAVAAMAAGGVAAPPPAPSPFFFLFLPFFLLEQRRPLNCGRGQDSTPEWRLSAASGPQAGARARPSVSAPPS